MKVRLATKGPVRTTTKATRSGAKGVAQAKPRAAPSPLDAVEAQLESYAQRGVFRSFSRVAFENGIADFRFFWLLNLPFQMSFDTKRKVIVFPKLLTKIEPASELDTELRAFLADCASPDRPEHRRLDPTQVRTSYANRRGTVTLTLRSLDGDWENATRKAIHLINEVFLNFLNARHPEYMIKTFRLPDE